MYWKKRIQLEDFEMRFAANEKANGYFKRYKMGGMLLGLVLAAFIVFEVMGNYLHHHKTSFTVFYTLLGVAGYGAYLYSIYRGIVLMNQSIRQIAVVDNTINIE